MEPATRCMIRWGVFALATLVARPDLPPLAAQQQQAAPFVQFDAGEGDDLSSVFLPTERTAKRRLDQARQLIVEKRFGEAVRMLDLILEAHEDSFFQADDQDLHYRSLKAEARRLIGQLPAAGRDAYQLQFGVRAQKMLEDATRAGDMAAIAEVARRYFHTDAGYEATLLLGQHHLDHQRPLAAALAFQQLVAAPHAAARFEPAVSVLAATSWLRAEMPDKARQTLAQLRERNPQAVVTIAGEEMKLFAPQVNALAWLQQTVGEAQSPAPIRADQWTMYRGSGGRNAQSQGGRPLLSPRWRVRTSNDPTVEKLVKQMRQSYMRQDIAALPSLHPIAVQDVVVMRTAQHLLAVDFKTGKRLWEPVEPLEDNDSFERLIKSGRSQTELDQMPQLALGLEQRMWDDAAYGTLSSDGERVFAVEDLELLVGLSSQRTRMLAIGGGVVAAQPADTGGPKTYNRLCAYSVPDQGKLLWSIGGPESDVPELQEAFFLGPPLPLGGNLYALAEIKGGIRLVVLDARSGALQWTQQLADLERNILQDPFRRLAGAVPSFTDGVLVCPTSAGAVVAVDLSTRSLLWAYRYPAKSSRQRQHLMMMMMRGYPAGQIRSNDAWCDATATIVDRRVLLTPTEADKLYCLNLLDGAELWQIDRGENLYLACVHQDKVILVGVEGVSAVNLSDGKPAWSRPLSLPEGSLPSGRGYYSGEHYYLPLTSAEVVKIDLNTGKIIERAKSRQGHVPGNLICYRGEVISQGVDFIETFYQVEALQQRVAAALKKNPNDPEALARLGELQFDAGKLPESIASLRRSFETDPNDLTRALLVRSLLEGLRVDFTGNRESLDELKKLVDQPEQQAELVRLTAVGLQQAGEILPAFEQYLQLIDLDDQEDQLEPLADSVSVRRSRWIQAQLAAMNEAATVPQREAMNAAISQRLDKLGADATLAELRRFLDYFGCHAFADEARLQLARRLIEGDATLECEALLRQLEKSHSAEYHRSAVALMAQLLAKADRVEHAALYYAQLAGELAEEPCLDGKTGRELLGELAPQSPIRAALAGSENWPPGEVKVTTVTPRGHIRTHRRMYPLNLRDTLGPFFSDSSVALDQNGLAIVGQDGYGRTQFYIPLNEPNSPRRSYVVNQSVTYGKTYGHLLVISMGYQILALDTLNAKQASWKNVLWREDLTEQVPGVSSHRRVRQVRRINAAGGTTHWQASDDQGRPIGTLGPVVPQGVTFQRHRNLVALDPLTGKTHWVRHDLPAGCDLFGDEHHLLVVPPGANEAIVLRPLDGSLLGTCPVPPLGQRVGTFGAKVLVLQTHSGRQELRLLDPWKRKTVWTQEVQPGAKLCRLDNEKLGVMQPDGRFLLLALEDGQPLVEQQLLPEPELKEIFVQQSSDSYLLITNRAAAPRTDGIRVSAAPGGLDNPLISGHVYCFDRATGKPRWPVPAAIEEHGLMLPQPSELPMLVFLRHIMNPHESGRHRTSTSVLCLDKRTGRALYEKDDFHFGTGFFNLEGDSAADTASVILPSLVIKLSFTGEPVPPEPPLQAARKEKPRSSSFVGSIFRALRDAAGELQQQRNEDAIPIGEPDPFE